MFREWLLFWAEMVVGKGFLIVCWFVGFWKSNLRWEGCVLGVLVLVCGMISG